MQLIVGVSSSVNPSGTDTDAVGVYRLIRDSTDSSSQNQDQWSQLGSILWGEEDGGKFGSYVAIAGSGNLIASAERDFSASGQTDSAGKVRAWYLSEGDWVRLGDDILGSAGDDMSYIDMSDDGMTLSVASPGADDFATDFGALRVFKWRNDAWVQQGCPIIGSSRANGTDFGRHSMSRDGSLIAVSSSGTDAANALTYVNESCDLPTAASSSSGTISAGGGSHQAAPANVTDNDLAKSGVIQIYRFSQGAWRPIGDPINGGQAEAYAWSTGFSADGGVLAVGARYYDGDAGENSGRVVAYELYPVSE
tara:strand:- start:30 stop:953 length:924 start_codon:yes stop_codon:yes gene_type:complete